MQLPITFDKEFDALYSRYANDPIKRRLLDLEGISFNKLDISKLASEYFSNRIPDISIDANANANEDISPNNYVSEITKSFVKLVGYYQLWQMMKGLYGLNRANEAIEAIWSGSLYFHDSVHINVPYCYAFSTTPIMIEGRPYGQLYSLPPKRSDSFVAQVIEVCMDVSQEQAGAVTPSDFIVNLCYFLKKENVDPDTEEGKYYIINLFQKFVHVMNNKFRVSGQSPFVNISLFDTPNLKKLFGETVYPDGSKVDIEYVMKVQKIIGEFLSKGDPATGLPYRFPVVTVNIFVNDKKTVVDKDFLKFVAETNYEKGIYNIYINDGYKIASCCRLLNDTKRMKFRADSFGNGGLNIGSHRIVTINFPRIALEAKGDVDKFFNILHSRVMLAKDILVAHRRLLEKRIEQGFLKFFKPLGWFSLKTMFSTFGVNGLYEACYFMDLPMETKKGQEFTERILRKMEEYADGFSEQMGFSWNVEEVPAESAAVTLAKKDKILFKQPFNLYSNQYIPLIADIDIIERLKISGKFMDIVSGGGIVHLNIQEKIPSPEKMEKIIKLAIKTGVNHFAINYGFGICSEGHTSIIGNGKTCPHCGKEIVDYMTRIIGYFTKVSSWNAVRREYEFPNRKFKAV